MQADTGDLIGGSLSNLFGATETVGADPDTGAPSMRRARLRRLSLLPHPDTTHWANDRRLEELVGDGEVEYDENGEPIEVRLPHTPHPPLPPPPPVAAQQHASCLPLTHVLAAPLLSSPHPPGPIGPFLSRHRTQHGSPTENSVVSLPVRNGGWSAAR